MTERCLRSVLQFSPPGTEVIVTDNGSKDETLGLLDKLAREDSRITVWRNATNEGISIPKRRACEASRSPFFVSLDNDAWVGGGWLEALRKPLDHDAMVMQVGRKGQHQSLRDDGIGKPDGPLEYIDGSCFMTRTFLANEIGVCDPYFPFAYGDDSDYSLRLRARGFKLATVDTPISHPPEESKAGHGGIDLTLHHETARSRFVKRWRDYLRRRAFDPTIAIRRTAALGDVVIATALPKRLKKLWPQSRIFFATKLPGVFDGNPRIESVIAEHAFEQLAPRMAYAWDLDLAYERDLRRPYWRSFAESTIFSGDEPQTTPELFPTEAARRTAEEILGPKADKERIAIVCGTPTGWAGKDANPDLWLPALVGLKRAGHRVLEVGLGPGRFNGAVDRSLVGQTSVPVLAALLERARIFMGLDSGPFHVAEAMGVPSVVIFGCTSSEVISSRPELLVPIRRPELDCLGCHHSQPAGTTRFMGCRRGDLACMALDSAWLTDGVERALAIAEAIGK